MTRHLCVRLHRYVGLGIGGFLILVGLTGSLLAFHAELNRLLAPQLFPPPKQLPALEMSALAANAESLIPDIRVLAIYLGEPGTAILSLAPRGNTAELPYNQLFLDPYTGAELGRRKVGGLPTGLDNLMPFVYRLHYNLALDMFGRWVLGIVALLWTLDSFASICLTLPARSGSRSRHAPLPAAGFWNRWKPAWRVKWRASAFRLNFDLHRAGGLWTWLALLVFAWSSVYMNLHEAVYAPATRLILDYPQRLWELPEPGRPVGQPRIPWREALEIGDRHWAEQGSLHGFTVERPIGMGLDRVRGLYTYSVRSSRDIQDRRGRTMLAFDADSGELKHLQLPSGQHSGLTVTMWLNALHDANVCGLPYRIFVCALGLVIAMLSATGGYIWWKKRRARILSAKQRLVASP